MSKYKSIEVSSDILFSCNKKIDSRNIREKDAGKWKNPKTGQWEDNKISYISGHTCIALLNEVFGSTWSFEVEKEWIENGIDFFKKETNYTSFPEDKITLNEKSERGMVVSQNPIAWCKGILTVYLKDEITGDIIAVKKTGYGSQSVNGDQMAQANTGYKGAQTDALKKAATLFGIGGQLYRDEKEQEYFDEIFELQLENQEVTEDKKQLISDANQLVGSYKDPKKILDFYANQVTAQTTTDLYKLPVKYLKVLIKQIKKGMKK